MSGGGKPRTEDNDLVFCMSNVMTHSPANNSGVWLQFENYCRDLVQTNPPHHLLGLLANQR